MGNKYYVHAWGIHNRWPSDTGYTFMELYHGESLIAASWTFLKSHLSRKWPMVKFEAR